MPSSVNAPIHASWLNQIEIYRSIVQREVLTPNDFSSLTHLEQCLKDLQLRYEQTASPSNGPSPAMIYLLFWQSGPRKQPSRPHEKAKW